MLSLGKARIGATHASFLGHTVSPAGVGPGGDKVRAFIGMPDPANVQQRWSLLGDIKYNSKFLENLVTTVRPLNALLKQGVEFAYTKEMSVIVKGLLWELSLPPFLVFPNWDAVAKALLRRVHRRIL